jgi:hypothetical protein
MSVPPNTPSDWITVRIQGRKADFGPDATVDDVLKQVRTLIGSKALKVPGGTAARHAYTPDKYAVVRKANVGTNDSGDWNPPDGRDDWVPWDLSTVEDGDELRVFGIKQNERPAYPEYEG